MLTNYYCQNMYLDMIVKLMVKHMYNKENKRRREPWEMSFLKVKEKNIRKYKKIYERTSICKIEDATHRVLNFVCCVRILRTTYFFDCLCVCSSFFL